MFVRKRVRETKRGTAVSFTVVESRRTEHGPRQRIVLSWSTPADPKHPRYIPSISAAIAYHESIAEMFRKIAERNRHALRTTNRPWIVKDTYRGPKSVHRDEIERQASECEATVAAEEAKASQFRDVMAELGDWTWDGSL